MNAEGSARERNQHRALGIGMRRVDADTPGYEDLASRETLATLVMPYRAEMTLCCWFSRQEFAHTAAMSRLFPNILVSVCRSEEMPAPMSTIDHSATCRSR